MDERSSSLDETVEQLAALHHEHERTTSTVQRVINRLTHALGRPATLAGVVLLMIGWMCGNYLAKQMGSHALEEFPFPDLAFVATVAALVIALLILTTQRHQDLLAERRAQLTLQIAILSERKVAKIISLLEEQRRENPMLASRVDEEAEALARPVDPVKTADELHRLVP